MPEPTERLPEPNHDIEPPKKQKTVDPLDLVSSGGYTGDPREIVENPAVTPEMPNEPGDLRGDMVEEE